MERDQCTSVPGYHSRSGISFHRSLLHHRTAVHERITDGDRTAGTGILKPCNVQYLQFLQAWKNCRTYITWILLLLCSWRTYRRYCCIRNENSWIFQRKLPAEAVTEAATLDQFNPLATIVTAVPSNIGTAFSSNNSILAVVVVAIVLGLCMNALGDKMKPLKSVLENLSDIINLYLTFLINKVGPVAIFCLISRTFAIYGAEYLHRQQLTS